jgi:Protein of unknown function (DUF4058)
MPSPFPGMDPYLEKPFRWPDVHIELISEIRAALNRQLDSSYFAQIQERIYISTEDDPGRVELSPDVQVTSQTSEGRAPTPTGETGTVEIAEPLVLETLLDEEIHEPYLEIIDAESRKVVTVIEVLSPTNKFSRSQGLKSFRRKRNTIMKSRSHWVEIDLLRRGVSLELRKRIRPHEYFVHVSPVHLRTSGWVWPIRLSQRLPVVRIPLRRGDDDARLDLQAVLDTAYDRAGYGRVIDYTKEPIPSLKPPWAEWSDRWLREKGVRLSNSTG